MSELQLVTSQLVTHLNRLSKEALEIHWITAFAMHSGVRIITPFLKEAADRGVPIKLLVGDYLFVTQPDALQLLLEELPSAEIRLWKSGGASFHPKSYLFRGKETSHLIVGSSNLSKSALTTGVEWSLIAPTSVDEAIFDEAVEQFHKHFYAGQTIPLNAETLRKYRELHEKANLRRPISPVWSEAEETGLMLGATDSQEVAETASSYITDLSPRPAQQQALDALDNVMEEDYSRAMVVLATGLGKTYLAAFFAKKFKRVLFVAHRQEILQQSKQSFENVHPNKTSAFYHVTEKDTSADFLFASIYTLGSDYHLNQFERDAFDLIVVDEFHHAASPTYRRLLEHFDPQFLLGITATPDRMDNQDVYALCDGNVAISIHFLDAIERNWLAPFRYFGVYDNTDYSKIRWLGNHYDEEELLQAQLQTEYAEAVFDAWQKHKQTRTIVFCSTVRQTRFMDQFFRERGIRSMSLSGETPAVERQAARAQLDSGNLEIIFTVDLFNEGVDIPKVDTLLFIRPTESLTVYTQQIGRGLRIAETKDHCVIIDFIGNYRNADLKLAVFDTQPQVKGKAQGVQPLVPVSCDFHLELEVVNLLEELRKKRAPRKEAITHAYRELKMELGRRPTYLEFHLQGKADSRAVKQEFGSWFGLLAYAAELNTEEIEVWTNHQSWFLEVEKTGMNKSYKMVVLSYMLSKGPSDWLNAVSAQEVAPYFHKYINEKNYRKNKDFVDKKTYGLRDNYDQKKVSKIVSDMPMTVWSKGARDNLITFIDNVFSINILVSKNQDLTLHKWTKEITEYRLQVYFERATNE